MLAEEFALFFVACCCVGIAHITVEDMPQRLDFLTIDVDFVFDAEASEVIAQGCCVRAKEVAC